MFLAHFLWVGLVLAQARAEWLRGAIIVMSFVTSNSAGLGAFITALNAPAPSFARAGGAQALVGNLQFDPETVDAWEIGGK